MADKIDLEKPAFGLGSEELEKKEPETTEVVKEEVKVVPEADAEESKVPYSRFKKFHDLAEEAKEEAEEWRAKYEALKEPKKEETSEMPNFWVKLYGDSPASQEAWKIQSERDAEIERRAYEAGQRGAVELREQESKRIDSNVEIIDTRLEALSDQIGRDLTEKEESALLDIVDEYTPKDRYGDYSGDIIPLDKAWEIYELKNGSSNTKTSRDSVASLTRATTRGETSNDKAEADKSFNPLDWNAYSKRL